MTDPFDPSSLGYASGGTASPRLRPARRACGYFLRGPIPWSWLTLAGRLPGRALQVGVVLWFWVGRRNSRTVSISLSAIARQFGFDQSSASRALAQLARARLISLEQAPGRKHKVTVLDVKEPD